MCVCVRICAHAYVYSPTSSRCVCNSCVCIHTYICIMHTHTPCAKCHRMGLNRRVYMCICMYGYVQTHKQISSLTYTHKNSYRHVYRYARIYTHTNIHTHTYIQMKHTNPYTHKHTYIPHTYHIHTYTVSSPMWRPPRRPLLRS